MKKVFSILILAAALVAVSCVGNANKANDQAEGTEVVAVVDSLAADKCCAEGQECTCACAAEGKECTCATAEGKECACAAEGKECKCAKAACAEKKAE